MPATEKGTCHVDVHDAVPVIKRRFHDGLTRDDARIVDQNVKCAQLRGDSLRNAPPSAFARDIEHQELCAVSGRAQFGGQALAIMLAQIADHDARATRSKQANRG